MPTPTMRCAESAYSTVADVLARGGRFHDDALELSGRPAEFTSLAEWALATFWPAAGGPVRMPTGTHKGMTLSPRLDHGRWVVDCPFCTGAALASYTDPRFYCCDCLHVGTDAEGRWVRVDWPRATTIRAVEEAVASRPEPRRNWWPDETIQHLRDENAVYPRVEVTRRLARGFTIPPEFGEPGATIEVKVKKR